METEFTMRLGDENSFFAIVKEIAEEPRFQETKKYIQHGSTSVYSHSLAVAYVSCYLAEHFRIKVRKRELIRGALLHDYFLYDWHEKSKEHSWHGFRHPGFALKNARRDFELTKVEENIIRTHMFPLVPILPKYKESYLVCLADKICSAYETTHRKELRWALYHRRYFKEHYNRVGM